MTHTRLLDIATVTAFVAAAAFLGWRYTAKPVCAAAVRAAQVSSLERALVGWCCLF